MKTNKSFNANAIKHILWVIGSLLFVVLVILFIVIELINTNLLKKGDIVFLGSYEQDSVIENGYEPIEWKVLSVTGSKVTLISLYGLDAYAYNEAESGMATTWEECTLRKWLNVDFYDKSFSDVEKSLIMDTSLKNRNNPITGVGDEKDTVDKVFLPACDDILGKEYSEDYYNVFINECLGEWICYPTAYADERLTIKRKKEYEKMGLDYKVMYSGGNSNDKDGEQRLNNSIDWILRTPGMEEGRIMAVKDDGDLTFEGYKNEVSRIIRPMICVDTSTGRLQRISDELEIKKHIPSVLSEESKDAEPDRMLLVINSRDSLSMISSLKQGDYIGFGTYEQDGNEGSGRESIEWQVLNNDGEKVLLISRYILDYQPYNELNDDIFWEESSLRKWLNDDFYNCAFSDFEKNIILDAVIHSDEKPEYENDVYECVDKVFILSYDDIINTGYGFDQRGYIKDIKRDSSYTVSALKKCIEAKKAEIMDVTTGEMTSGSWWLRNRSSIIFFVGENERLYTGTKIIKGYYSSGENLSVGDGVRPAIYIKVIDGLIK